jgi:hypothetical protein
MSFFKSHPIDHIWLVIIAIALIGLAIAGFYYIAEQCILVPGC